jgi:copper chaperone CopZ
MRAITISVLLCAALLQGCSAGAPRAAEGERAEAVFEVFGMDCPGCHGGVEKNIKKVRGVTGAKANWSESRISVFYEPGTELDVEGVEKAITASNFTPGKRIK